MQLINKNFLKFEKDFKHSNVNVVFVRHDSGKITVAFS